MDEHGAPETGEEVLDMTIEATDIAVEFMNLIARRMAEGAAVATIGAGLSHGLTVIDQGAPGLGTAIRKLLVHDPAKQG